MFDFTQMHCFTTVQYNGRLVSNDPPRIGFMINRNGLQRPLRRNCPALNVVHRSPINVVKFLCNLIIPRRLISSGFPFVFNVSTIYNLL